jgi:hypothetical protein
MADLVITARWFAGEIEALSVTQVQNFQNNIDE